MMMKTDFMHRLMAVIGITFWLVLANMSWAADNRQYQFVNGLKVYIGVLPAGMTMPHSPGDSSGEAHGGTPAWGEQYHVIVTLVDNASGARIPDAEVSAAVFNATLPGRRVSGPKKTLEPMEVASGTAYGNYFNMPGSTPYRIEVEIRRRNASGAMKAAFNYRHSVVTAKPPS